MNAINHETLQNNIVKAMELRGVKVSELERQLNLSPGYFARLQRTGKAPSLETLYGIAKTLNINIEWLIEGDSMQSAQNLDYLTAFVQRLFDQTVAGQLDWGSIEALRLNDLLDYGDISAFPFIVEDPAYPYPLGSNEAMFQRFPFCSNMHGKDGIRRIHSLSRPDSSVVITSSVFWADLPGGQRIHLIPFGEIQAVGDEQEEYCGCGPVKWYELLFENLQTHALQVIANTAYNNRPLHPVVDKLYAELAAHQYDIQVAPGVRQLIDGYMEQTAPLSRAPEDESPIERK